MPGVSRPSKRCCMPSHPCHPSRLCQPCQILTAWMIHASTRGVQIAMRELAGQDLSLSTISAVLAEAEQRALTWMQTHTPATVRALAIDEIYATDRRGAYLNVVDVHSGAV